MRRFVFAGLLLLATAILLSRLTQVTEFLQVIRRGRPLWIGAAFIVQAAWQINQVAQFRAAHRAAGVEQSLRQMAPVVLANNFALVAAPSGSASTFALFLENARQRNLSPSPVSLAVALFAVFQYLTTNITLAAALTLLYQRRALNAGETIPALIIFGVTLTMTALFMIGLGSVARLERLIAPPIRLANRLLRRKLVSETAVHRFLADAEGGMDSFRHQPLTVRLAPFAFALGGEGLAMILLGAIFVGFRQPISPAAIVVGVSMSALFSVVSPTPLGIGLAEGATALVLTTLNVPLESAIVISLTYRGFVVWLPMLYGFVALQAAGLRAVASRT